MYVYIPTCAHHLHLAELFAAKLPVRPPELIESPLFCEINIKDQSDSDLMFDP